jgi:hypothetical protein
MSMPTLTFPVQKNNQAAFGLVAGATLILLGMSIYRLLKQGFPWPKTLTSKLMDENSGSHTVLYLLLLALVVAALFMLCSTL